MQQCAISSIIRYIHKKTPSSSDPVKLRGQLAPLNSRSAPHQRLS
jgi:hypothetical protein